MLTDILSRAGVRGRMVPHGVAGLGRSVRVNLSGLIHLARRILPEMLERGEGTCWSTTPG